jgi:hypothetical protein
MDSDDCGDTLFYRPKAVGKALIVMNNVVVLKFVPQKPVCPEPKGEGFGKTHGPNAQAFHNINRIAEFSDSGQPEKGIRVVKVKAGKPENLDIFIKAGIGRPGYHLHMVPEVFQSPAQVF